MKIKFQSPNGPAQIISLGVQGRAATGQAPTAAPGVAALQILQGWGHGSTAGLGGADWSAGCGTFRGEAYRMGPSFGQESTDGKACDAAGIGRLCSPSMPKGVWLLPWMVEIPPGGEISMTLTLPVAGRLFALELDARRLPDAGGTDPCPCDLDGTPFVFAGQWSSQQITTAYPGLGAGTSATLGGVIVPYNPNTEMVGAAYYSSQRLLAGQNFLPPWVPNVDLRNGNDQLNWVVSNTGPTLAVVRQTLHLAYGGFDLAAAVEAYCDEQKACAC